MKRVFFEKTWEDSWKYSYPYDLMEIYKERKTPEQKAYGYSYDNRREQTINFITKVLPDGKGKILDVAAAQGNFSLTLAELGYQVVWNDLRSDLIDYVKMKYEKGDLTFAPGDVFSIDFQEKFDAVLITEIIEHVAHPDEFLKKITKIVKPNGYIILTTPLGDYFLNTLPKFSEFADPSIFEVKQFQPNSEGHIFLLHLDEFATLAKLSNLSIIKMQYYTNLITAGHFKTRYLTFFLSKKIFSVIDKMTQMLPTFLGRKIHTNIAILFQKIE